MPKSFLTAVAIEHDGHGDVTLRVGTRTVAWFSGEHKRGSMRKPFWEYSHDAAFWAYKGIRKASGEYVVNFATDLGVPREEARRVVNEALAHLGWPEVAAEERPSGGVLETTIVAVIADGYVDLRNTYPPGIYHVLHAPGVDLVAAIKAAAQEFVSTPEGQEYLETDVGSDTFNWGDAVVAIPPEILARHGIRALVVADLGCDVEVVDHDEALVETPR